jgi:hypothetical protein
MPPIQASAGASSTAAANTTELGCTPLFQAGSKTAIHDIPSIPRALARKAQDPDRAYV